MPNMEELHQYDEGPQNNSNDDFLEQMLSIIPNCTWPPHPPSSNPNDPTLKPTASPPQDHAAAVAFPFSLPQPNNVGAAAAKSLLLQHQQLLLSRGFKPTADATQPGFVGSLHGNGQQQHFHSPPPPPPTAASTGGSSGGGAPQRQRVRARRGQATDPHSIAERLRRERIAERMKALQELVPNGNKTDKASMLDEIIDYVRFLQLQVKVLSMSRLGGAPAVAPQVTDMSSEGGGGAGLSSNGSLRNDNMTVTEHQVAKLMEEDMGSAMQYLQGKGLCLMPISLATAISTATCQPRDLSRTHDHHNNHSLLPFNPVDESPPNMSGLTVQSASAAAENTINNASKP